MPKVSECRLERLGEVNLDLDAIGDEDKHELLVLFAENTMIVLINGSPHKNLDTEFGQLLDDLMHKLKEKNYTPPEIAFIQLGTKIDILKVQKLIIGKSESKTAIQGYA
jgi:hypothetical protein